MALKDFIPPDLPFAISGAVTTKQSNSRMMSKLWMEYRNSLQNLRVSAPYVLLASCRCHLFHVRCLLVRLCSGPSQKNRRVCMSTEMLGCNTCWVLVVCLLFRTPLTEKRGLLRTKLVPFEDGTLRIPFAMANDKRKSITVMVSCDQSKHSVEASSPLWSNHCFVAQVPGLKGTFTKHTRKFEQQHCLRSLISHIVDEVWHTRKRNGLKAWAQVSCMRQRNPNSPA